MDAPSTDVRAVVSEQVFETLITAAARQAVRHPDVAARTAALVAAVPGFLRSPALLASASDALDGDAGATDRLREAVAAYEAGLAPEERPPAAAVTAWTDPATAAAFDERLERALVPAPPSRTAIDDASARTLIEGVVLRAARDHEERMRFAAACINALWRVHRLRTALYLAHRHHNGVVGAGGHFALVVRMLVPGTVGSEAPPWDPTRTLCPDPWPGRGLLPPTREELRWWRTAGRLIHVPG
jgi:hypothetical protein